MKNNAPKMKRSPELDTLQELLDEIATIRVINKPLPLKYGFVIEQFIQKLENQITICHDTELDRLIKELPSIHNKDKKRNANRKR